MTRFLLDTNIISNLVKPEPSPSLVAWMAERRDTELFLSALSIAEIRRGILELPSGRRRMLLEEWFDGVGGPPALFAGRILPFDEAVAMIWARLMAEGRTKGRPRSALDMVIAATALHSACVLVTDNEADFPDIELINPIRGRF